MANEIQFIINGVDRLSGPFRQASGSMGVFGVAAKAAGAAAAALTGVLVANTVAVNKHVIELTRFAQISNTTVQEFQKMSFAAAQFGVEEDKLADILKDVEDRIGDFVQTGGGPMLDFFEQVGPKVGVTADHFRDLSGPDALQLFAESLDKANLSQADTTFFMEAMASDLTQLQPLFKDGSKLLNEYGLSAENMGLILSDQAIANSKAFNRELNLMTGAMSGVSQGIGTTLTPLLAGIFRGVGETVANSRKPIIDFFDGLVTGAFTAAAIFKQVFDRISGLISSVFSGKEGFLAFIDNIKEAMNKAATFFKDTWFSAVKSVLNYFKAYFKLIATAATEVFGYIKDVVVAAFTRKDIPSIADFLFDKLPEKLEESKNQFRQAVVEMGDLMFKTAEVVTESTGSMLGINVASARAMADTWRKNIEIVGTTADEAKGKGEESHTGFVDRLREKSSEMIKNQQDLVTTFAENMALTLENATAATGSAVANALVEGKSLADGMRQVFKNVAKEVIAGLVKMGAQRIITSTIFQNASTMEMIKDIGRAGASAFGNTYSSIAAIPVVGPFLAPAAAAAALVAVVAGMKRATSGGGGGGGGQNQPAVSGVAHGGMDYIPRESTFLLDKGERVLSPRQNTDLTSFLNNEGQAGGGGQSNQVVIQSLNISVMPNATNADSFLTMSKLELRERVAIPLMEAIEDLQLQGYTTQTINRSTS